MVDLFNHLAEHARDEPIYPDNRFPPSPYYRFLKLLAQELKPRISVELGVCGGGGSLHLCIGNPEGWVIGIDNAWDHAENINHISKNYSNFVFMLDDSVKSARKVGEDVRYGKVDILFIDTDHRYQRTLDEFNAWKPFLSSQAVVLFDDILRHHPDDSKSVGDAFNEIPGNKHRIDFLHDGTYPFGGGFGIWWR